MTLQVGDDRKQTFQQLIEALERCLSVYSELVGTAQMKHRLIIEGERDGMFALIEREADILERFTHANESRVLAVKRCLEDADDPARVEMSMAEVMRRLDSEAEREKLRRMLAELNESAKQLHSWNERNQLLLREDYSLLHDTLDAILGPAETETGYRNPQSDSRETSRKSGIDLRM